MEIDRHACFVFFFNVTPTTEIYTLSLHDALPIYGKFKKIYNLVLASSQRIGYGAPVNGILCQIEVSVI